MTKKFLSVLLLLMGVVQGAMAQEPYAVLSDDNSVFTFYYDTQMAERGGMSVGPFEYDYNTYQPNTSWYPQRESITTVVFDDSFADCTSLTSTACWFYTCNNLTTILGIKNLKTDNVMSMSNMFAGCRSLTSLDVSGFKTDNVTDMSSMFSDCKSLTHLDVSSFKTENVTNMFFMFSGCDSLESLDLSNFNTENVTDMGGMFLGSGLTSLDLSGFKTDNVTDMIAMFKYCYSLTSLDLSSFKTNNVTDMSGMFGVCQSLTSLDVSNFDTGNVTSMVSMFSNCSGLEDIFCNDTWSCSNSNDMFSGCSKLAGFNSSNLDASYAKPVADGDGGYFTAKTEKANKVGGNYWWTYYTDVRNVKADWHTTVYTATLNAEGTELTLNEVTDKIVPRGQAVIMKSTTGEPMLYTSTETGTGDFSTNVLHAARNINIQHRGHGLHTCQQGRRAGLLSLHGRDTRCTQGIPRDKGCWCT